MKPRYTRWNRALQLTFAAAALCGAAQAHADPVTRSICVYDPNGANGDIYLSLEGYMVSALQWGVRFDPKPYTDEDVAASDFKSGKCDAISLTGVHNIEFVKFAGSLDMVGGLQTYDEEHKAIEAMLSPKAAKFMSSGNFETVSVVPGGKVYLFARHKENLTSLMKAAGQKIAVLGFDKQAVTLANDSGAAPVPSTIVTFGPKFNNGSVEYAYAPAYAYKPFELYKGLGTQGGIADYVLGMLSVQVDIHKDRFPVGFGQQSRTWSTTAWDSAMVQIKEADDSIPASSWVHITPEQTKTYSTMLIKVRQDLWNDGWYDHDMQHLLKQIRCQSNPSAGECTLDSEGGPV
jgi:hypothetical protein